MWREHYALIVPGIQYYSDAFNYQGTVGKIEQGILIAFVDNKSSKAASVYLFLTSCELYSKSDFVLLKLLSRE